MKRRHQRDGYASLSRRVQQNRTDRLWAVHATPGSRKLFRIAIQAGSVATLDRYEAMRPGLASSGSAPKRLPNTGPKKPHGIALIKVAYLISSMGRPISRAVKEGQRRLDRVLEKRYHERAAPAFEHLSGYNQARKYKRGTVSRGSDYGERLTRERREMPPDAGKQKSDDGGQNNGCPDRAHHGRDDVAHREAVARQYGWPLVSSGSSARRLYSQLRSRSRR